MRKNTTFVSREPDVVDVAPALQSYSTFSTWLDDNKVTVSSSFKSFTSSNKERVERGQYTLTMRGGTLRLLNTRGKGITEYARTPIVKGVLSRWPKATQLLVSGHLFDYFCHGKEFIEKVIEHMWPMLPHEFMESPNRVHPAFRRNNAFDFLHRLVGFGNYSISEFMECHRREANPVYILQSVPPPLTTYDFRDLLNLLEAAPEWREATWNTKQLPFDRAVEIIKHGMPSDKYKYGALDLTGHRSLQSAYAARHANRHLTGSNGALYVATGNNNWSLTGSVTSATITVT